MIEQIITSSVLIVAVLLLSTILEQRVNPRISYALWLLVAIKLLVPLPEFESQISIMNVARQFQESEDLLQNVILQDMQVEKTGMAVEAYWLSGFQMVWIVGMVLCSVAFVGSNIRFAFFLKKKRLLAGQFQNRLKVYQVQNISSPCLFGLVRPSIYLQESCDLTEEQMQYVCAHEYMHYRHGDHVWAVVRCVCVIVYWFNPLVWIAARTSMKDSELACDAGTLKMIGDRNHVAYGQTLLYIVGKAVSGQTVTKILDCSADAIGGGKEMKKRMQMIKKQPGTKVIAVVALMVVCVSLVGCTFGSEVENTESFMQTEVESQASLQEGFLQDVAEEQLRKEMEEEAEQAALEEQLRKKMEEEAEQAALEEQLRKEAELAALEEQLRKEAELAALEEQLRKEMEEAVQKNMAKQEEVKKRVVELEDAKKRKQVALQEYMLQEQIETQP